MLLILVRKMPALNFLPQNGDSGVRSHRLVLDAENKIKNIFVFFEKQIFLHKFLSWVKVMTLRTETKVDHMLHGIRKKAQQIDKQNKDKR